MSQNLGGVADVKPWQWVEAQIQQHHLLTITQLEYKEKVQGNVNQQQPPFLIPAIMMLLQKSSAVAGLGQKQLPTSRRLVAVRYQGSEEDRVRRQLDEATNRTTNRNWQDSPYYSGAYT